MERKEKSKKYEGQALAITMVVLIVSALIGLSIHSRSMKDRMLTLEERASAEALEVSDLILERLTSLPTEDVLDAALETATEAGANLDDGIVLVENDEENLITELLGPDGLEVIGGQTFSELLSPICPIGETGNEYQLTLKTADEDTFYEVRPGHVWSLPARDVLEGAVADGGGDCALNMNFAIRGDSRAGFIVSKIYCNDYDENGIPDSCEKYAVGDFDKYCFSDNGAECNNDNFLNQDNWTKLNPNEESLPQIVMSDVSAPSEVRIKAVGGTIGISYSLPAGCVDGLRMFQLRATANCQGVYRGKEILVPEEKWHETIFDYVIFNAEGSI